MSVTPPRVEWQHTSSNDRTGGLPKPPVFLQVWTAGTRGVPWSSYGQTHGPIASLSMSCGQWFLRDQFSKTVGQVVGIGVEHGQVRDEQVGVFHATAG